MTSFVRKNLIQINARFVPPGFKYWNKETNSPNPAPPQPATAVAVLKFKSSTGLVSTSNVSMTLGSDGITWSCSWDSSAAGEGAVSWVVYAAGGVQSANQGVFTILANPANTF